MEALKRLLPEAPQYVSRKQLEILSGTQWYVSEGLFDAGKSFRNWAARGRAAEAHGFVGARTTELPSGLNRTKIGASFCCMNKLFIKRLKANVSFPCVGICSAQNMIGTFASHHAVMMHEGGTWGDTWQHLELRVVVALPNN